MADEQEIVLRTVLETDLPVFFEQECDPIANRMAAYAAKDEPAFLAHWRDKVLGNDAVVKRTILFGDRVAGNIECWEADGKWLIGYWIGRPFWGKGIATAALRAFLPLLKPRPLYAYVANHNQASLRVLEKCGFTRFGHGRLFSRVHGEEIDETILVCN